MNCQSSESPVLGRDTVLLPGCSGPSHLFKVDRRGALKEWYSHPELLKRDGLFYTVMPGTKPELMPRDVTCRGQCPRRVVCSLPLLRAKAVTESKGVGREGGKGNESKAEH